VCTSESKDEFHSIIVRVMNLHSRASWSAKSVTHPMLTPLLVRGDCGTGHVSGSLVVDKELEDVSGFEGVIPKTHCM